MRPKSWSQRFPLSERINSPRNLFIGKVRVKLALLDLSSQTLLRTLRSLNGISRTAECVAKGGRTVERFIMTPNYRPIAVFC